MSDGKSERFLRFGELFEVLDKPTVAESTIVLLFPSDHSEGTLFIEPLMSNELNPLVACDEDAIALRRVLEEDVVSGFFREDINGTLDVPTSLSKALDELLTDVRIRQEPLGLSSTLQVLSTPAFGLRIDFRLLRRTPPRFLPGDRSNTQEPRGPGRESRTPKTRRAFAQVRGPR